MCIKGHEMHSPWKRNTNLTTILKKSQPHFFPQHAKIQCGKVLWQCGAHKNKGSRNMGETNFGRDKLSAAKKYLRGSRTNMFFRRKDKRKKAGKGWGDGGNNEGGRKKREKKG